MVKTTIVMTFVTYFFAIALMLFTVRLIKNQKHSILIPAAISIFFYSTTTFIIEYYYGLYTIQFVYHPSCEPNDSHFLSLKNAFYISRYYANFIFKLNMAIFFIINRFPFQALNFIMVMIELIYKQVVYRHLKCFDLDQEQGTSFKRDGDEILTDEDFNEEFRGGIIKVEKLIENVSIGLLVLEIVF